MTRVYQWLKRLFVAEHEPDLDPRQLADIQRALKEAHKRQLAYIQTLKGTKRYELEGLHNITTSFRAAPVLSTPWLRSATVKGKHDNWMLGNEAEFIWPHRPSLRRPFNWRFHA